MLADSIRPAMGQVNTSYGSLASVRPNQVQGESECGAPVADSFTVSGADQGIADHKTISLIMGFGDAKSAGDVKKALGKQGCEFGESLPIVNGFTVNVDAGKVDQILASLPEGVTVAEDGAVVANLESSKKSSAADATAQARKPDPAVAQALIGIDKVWEQGFTGSGQTIAVIDSGIYPHPDLKDKIVGWVDVSHGAAKPLDEYGHGTHVAGIAAGSGVASAGAHKGVAPDANLVGVRIGSVSEAIKGIQWCIEHKDEHNIGVINMSLGDFAKRSYKDDPWSQAAQKAMDAGIVVVVAAGNEGSREGTISTPGINPNAITVGALDDGGTLDKSDDKVADFSSRGPTAVDGLKKPDLLAPGVDVFSTTAKGAYLDDGSAATLDGGYMAMSGTSMATPMVAGLAACLLQANPDMTQEQVKEILTASCDDYLPGEEKIAKGAGLVNAEKALQLALDLKAQTSAPQEAAPLGNQDSQGFLMA